MSKNEEGKQAADPVTFKLQRYGSGTTKYRPTKLLLDNFIPCTQEKETYSPTQWKMIC